MCYLVAAVEVERGVVHLGVLLLEDAVEYLAIVARLLVAERVAQDLVERDLVRLSRYGLVEQQLFCRRSHIFCRSSIC